MNYKQMKRGYTFSCIVLCLIFLAPTLAFTLPIPREEKFSELWILGPDHTIESLPSNVVPEVTYHVILGLSNQMGGLEYYLIRVKLGSQSEPLPDNSIGIPSNLSAIYEYRIFLQKNDVWETDLSFTFENFSFEGNVCRASTIMIDGNPVNVNKTTIQDEGDKIYYYQLFFELWLYNYTLSSFQFHERSVGFWVKVSR